MTDGKRESGGRHAASAPDTDAGNPRPKIEATGVYTEKETAAFLSLKPQTLSKWRCHKTTGPKWIQLGGAIRYRGSDVLEWLAQQTRACDGTPIVGPQAPDRAAKRLIPQRTSRRGRKAARK